MFRIHDTSEKRLDVDTYHDVLLEQSRRIQAESRLLCQKSRALREHFEDVRKRGKRP
jgi:hypothetical protein